jgi:hypothetical protein
MTEFPPCSTSMSYSQAYLCHYTDKTNCQLASLYTFVLLRYSLVGDLPSQTVLQT